MPRFIYTPVGAFLTEDGVTTAYDFDEHGELIPLPKEEREHRKQAAAEYFTLPA